MSEISEKATKLIKDLRRDMWIDVMFTPEKDAESNSLKALSDYIAELEAFKKLVNGCGFDVVTEPAIPLYPERKVLIRHGTVYVPAKDWEEREK